MANKVSVKVAIDIDACNAHYVIYINEYGETKEVTVATNRNGEGLWIDGRQIEGTGQFDLNVKDQAAKLRRYFRDVEW